MKRVSILLAGMLLLLTSCGGGALSRVEQERIKAGIDSVVQATHGIDSLSALEAGFQQEGNLTGVLLASQRLGKEYRNHSRFQEAINAHSRALEIASQQADTVEVIRAYNNLGTDYRRMGVMDEAMHHHTLALTYCEVYSDQTSDVAVKNRVISLNGIGNIYMTIENYTAADSVLRAALAGEQQLGSELGQAINWANLGAIKQSHGELDSARVYYERSLELNNKAGSVLGISLCHNYLGSLEEQQGHFDSAIEDYTLSHDLLRPTGDKWHYLEACVSLARVWLKRGNARAAVPYIERSDSLATDINSVEHIAQVENLWYELAMSRGDYAGALNHFRRYAALEDSVRGNENINVVQNMRLRHERERREALVSSLNDRYNATARTHNIILTIGVLVLLLALVLIAFLLYSLRMKARHQALLEHMDKVRSDFFTNVTHEFRTPLTVITGVAEDIKRNATDPAVADKAAAIERQGANLYELITQLLDISRVQSAIGNAEWRTGDIVTYIAMIVEGMRPAATAKDIELAFTHSQDAINMDFVPYYLHRVVGNLVSNSIKFTPQYGSITINVQCEGERLLLTVSDSGIGISDDDLPHIFEPFYQGAHGPEVTIGTGVGLSLVKQIVDVMGGTVTVESKLNTGTRFVVTMPLRHGESGYAAPDKPMVTVLPPAEPDVPEDAQPEQGKPTVLIVEDNVDVARYEASQLDTLYNIITVTTGRDALAKARELMPDVIITDVMMPGMIDGYELCRQVRASQVLSHIPVVMVSARSTTADRITGIEAGADDYLYKPFNADELRTVVAKLLARREMLRAKYAAAPDTTSQPSPRPEVQLPFTASDTSFLERFVAVVDGEMERGADAALDASSLALRMKMSVPQLRRKMMALTGKTLMAYVTDVRMACARRLLDEHPEMSIADVALRCGYLDQAYFSRQFKQQEGLSPLQYRSRGN